MTPGTPQEAATPDTAIPDTPLPDAAASAPSTAAPVADAGSATAPDRSLRTRIAPAGPVLVFLAGVVAVASGSQLGLAMLAAPLLGLVLHSTGMRLVGVASLGLGALELATGKGWASVLAAVLAILGAVLLVLVPIRRRTAGTDRFRTNPDGSPATDGTEGGRSPVSSNLDLWRALDQDEDPTDQDAVHHLVAHGGAEQPTGAGEAEQQTGSDDVDDPADAGTTSPTTGARDAGDQTR